MQPDDSYYLKALDNYPYNLEEALEALQYGLSANPEHPGLLTLQGRIFAYEMDSPAQAMESFSAAIAYDPGHKPAWYELGMLLLNKRQLKRATKVIEQATDQFGNHDRQFLYLRAYLSEIEGRYDDAIGLLESAKLNCYSTSNYDHYCDEIKRIRQKCRKPLTIGGYRITYELK